VGSPDDTIGGVKRGDSFVVLALTVALGAGLLGCGGPAGSSAAASASGAASPIPSTASEAPATEEPSLTAAPSAAPAVGGAGSMAIVPVTNFRSAITSTSSADVAAILAGTSDRFDSLELVSSEADAILGALGAARPAVASRLVLAPSADALATDLAAHRKRLAMIRADAVTERVRALAWGGSSLFGVGRVGLAAWPLKANLQLGGGPAYDPAKAWTLVAGGDILLDRGVARTVKILGKGVDYPFEGGTASITSRYCCSSFGWNLPRTVRTDNAGAVRRLLRGADLAIANFENPAPDNFAYHTKGTVFSADPRLIDGLRNAGIDYVSLANNHIRDAGAQGILDTISNLDKRGIDHSGAGRNLAAARRPAILRAGGVRMAILGYDTIAKGYAATATRAGSAQLSAAVVKADVAAARRAGADVVIVFPHWGTEYDPTPFAGQQRLARACIDAGADLVIGNHAHWAGAIETYKGKPIWYALGNFVFDQTWSEPTMEGITLELTFSGADLVQVRMRPHVILDKAQPNFMDPAGAGRVVMGQVFNASKGLLDW
jgi:capsule synthesis protein PGA_cap